MNEQEEPKPRIFRPALSAHLMTISAWVREFAKANGVVTVSKPK